MVPKGANNPSKHGMVIELVKASPFLKNNAIFFAGSLVVAALNYLYYPILGRLLSPADFGEVQTLISVYTQAAIFLSILSFVTIHATVNMTDERERNHALLGLERLAVLGGYFVLAIFLIFADNLKAFLNFTEVWPFLALILALAISIHLPFRTGFLRGSKLYLKSSMTDGIASVFKLIFAVIFVLAGYKSLGAVAGLAIAQAVALFMAMRWAGKAGFKGFGFFAKGAKISSLKPQLHYARAVLLASLSVIVLQTLAVIAIKHYFTPHEAGLFAGVATVANIIYFLLAPITGVLITMVSPDQIKSKNRLQLKGSYAIMAVIGGTAMLFIAFLPELLIKVLIGPKYLTYADYLPKLGITMLILALANLLLMYQISLRRFEFSLTSLVVLLSVLISVYYNHATIIAVVNDVLIGAVGLFLILAAQSAFLTNNLAYEEG